ncbi:hypothetical protein Aca07nite_18650 [Actinoplanes capillaceus]|uniref:DUF2293 domain-containing protein n=1 Tax=Actinoplanes campanulatus TaxID=113559 RepID=A0ABQ3WF58_9ACTN|nr:DUF2293 domain-containing protein [Actinoplanes capillaceus]GID44590.1 hypothetical protein Aca07nite_18650 [Actinoplanes capillaceus]
MPPAAKLERRVVTAAEQALERQRHVCPLDVLTGMGWLPPGLVTDWRQGRAPDLESVAAVSADRLTDALEIFHRWVEGRGLRPSEVDYPSATRDRRPLRFTMEDAGPICLTCADLDHLVFLPAGDAALTRRAKAASRLSAVVVRFNRSRKRHERQGLLVEQAALDQAEQQCLSDEEARARRRERDRERREAADETFQHDLATEITRLFPGCPPDRAESISRHTSIRGSGRVGRSAAGRALDPDAVTRAVIASVRHEDTPYDELLMSGVPRDEARARIRDAIDRILTRWR